MSQTPGPGAYAQADPNVYKGRAPLYTLRSRVPMPGDNTLKPGPGAHSPERVGGHYEYLPTYCIHIPAFLVVFSYFLYNLSTSIQFWIFIIHTLPHISCACNGTLSVFHVNATTYLVSRFFCVSHSFSTCSAMIREHPRTI